MVKNRNQKIDNYLGDDEYLYRKRDMDWNPFEEYLGRIETEEYFTLDFDHKGEVVPIPYSRTVGKTLEESINDARYATNRYRARVIDKDTYYRLQEFIKKNKIRVDKLCS